MTESNNNRGITTTLLVFGAGLIVIAILIVAALGEPRLSVVPTAQLITQRPIDRTDVAALDYRLATNESALREIQATREAILTAEPSRIDIISNLNEQGTLVAVQSTMVSSVATRQAIPTDSAIQTTLQANMDALATTIGIDSDLLNEEFESITTAIDDLDANISGVSRRVGAAIEEIATLRSEVSINATQAAQNATIAAQNATRVAELSAPLTATAEEATRIAEEICFLLPIALRGGSSSIFSEPDFNSRQTGEYIRDDEDWIATGQLGYRNITNWWQVAQLDDQDTVIGWVPENIVRFGDEDICAAKPIVEPG